MKKVTTIPATIKKYTATPISDKQKRRVAGYARVSTDFDDQTSSYEAQIDYYTNYIKSRSDWVFVDLYTDEGISGTNTKHREGFNTMIADALAGKIDLIVTKSVSRFARNTVDSLTTVRKLRDKGIEVYFEKENIWTLDSKGELLITIMSSLAQEESRSISENVTWGHRKRFADGKVSLAYKNFLGYDKGEDGNLVVNKEQAKTVRHIYKLFLDGLSPYTIAKTLTEMGVPTPSGKKVWSTTCVRSILSNEKYKGDALLQKEFTVDFLQKKIKKNEGEVPQYYIEGNHEAIIEPYIFDYVQVELAKRTKDNMRNRGNNIFSGKIKCGECGSWFGAKVWHSTDKYKRVVYQCNKKYKKPTPCTMPHLTEDEIKQIFVNALNKLHAVKDDIIANMQLVLDNIANDDKHKDKEKKLAAELEITAEMIKRCVSENARVALKQDDYNERFNKLVKRHEEIKQKLDMTTSAIKSQKYKADELKRFIQDLNKTDMITEFDKKLWLSLTDYIEVKGKNEYIVYFKNGSSINVNNS